MTSLQWSEAKEELLSFQNNAVVSASAGTGKTTALAEFVVRQLSPDSSSGVDDLQNLVAITYTEKAAGELKERIRQFILDRMEVEDRSRVGYWDQVRRSIPASYIGTIHSICSRIIRENAFRLGMDPTFDVVDKRNADRLLSGIILQFIVENVREKDPRMQRLLQAFGFDEIGYQRQDLKQVFFDHLEQFWNNGFRVEQVRELMEHRFQQAEQKLEEAVERANTYVDEILALSEDDLTEKSAKRLRTFRGVAPDLKSFLRSVNEGRMNMRKFVTMRRRAKSVLKGNMSRSLKEKSDELRDLIGAPLANPEPGTIQKLVAFLKSRDLHEDLLSSLEDIELRFRRKKREQGAIDFHDLLFLTRDLLKGDPNVRRRYKEKFQFLLVDEFQDVNQLQFDILYLLSESLSEEAVLGDGDSVLDRVQLEPASFVAVGDGKQSIYRFRGADVSVFQEVFRKIENNRGKQYTFRENYRSTPGVISFLNHFFQGTFPGDSSSSQVSFSDEDLLVPTRDPVRSSETPSVEMLSPPEPSGSSEELRELEGETIADRIHSMVHGGDIEVQGEDDQTRSPRYGDIAVLFRSMTHLSPYEQAFRERNVPYQVFRGKEFYETQEIRDIANVFRLLKDPHDVIALFGYLKSPMVGVIEDTVLKLKTYADNCCDGSVKQAFLDYNEEELDEKERMKLRRARSIFQHLRRYKDLVTPDELVRELIRKTNYTAVYMEDPRYRKVEANVEKLIGILRKRSESEQGFSFSRAEQFLNNAVSNRISEEEASVSAGMENKVQLMSVHSAKGLEFPVVLIADMGSVRVRVQGPCLFDPDWGIGVRWRDPSSDVLHKTWSHSRVRETIRKKEKSEYYRMLYVAMTRARDYLILSGWYQRSRTGTWWNEVDQYLQAHCHTSFDDLFQEENTATKESVLTIQDEEQRIPIRVVQESSSESTAMESQNQIGEGLEDIEAFFHQNTTDNVQLPEEDSEAIERTRKREQYSVTELLEMICCPRRFAFLFREELPEDVGRERMISREEFDSFEWQQMGRLAHDLLESIPLGDEPSPNQLKTLVNQSKPGRYVSEEGENEVIDAVLNCYREFLASEISDEHEVHRELSFVSRLERNDDRRTTLVEGTTDLLLVSEEEVFIIDYKFARNRPEKYEDDRLQLLLYAMAMGNVFGTNEANRTVRCGIYYLREETRDGALREIVPSEEDMEQFRDRVDRVIRSSRSVEAQSPMEWPGEPDESVCRRRRCGFISFCHGESLTS